jgi:hypothetical protein
MTTQTSTLPEIDATGCARGEPLARRRWIRPIPAALACCLLLAPAAGADVQVNAPDHNVNNQNNNTTQSETNVAISGSNVVVGYNSSKEAGLLGMANWHSLSGFAYSTNGGASFTDGGFVPPPPAPGRLTGDPALAFDRTGSALYYASIGNDAAGASKIFVSKATGSFAPPVFAAPVAVSGLANGTQDKEFIAVDKTNGTYDGRVYVAWTEFVGANGRVVFAAAPPSLAFSATIPLSAATGLHQGAMPAVGPNGHVYVVWGFFTSTTAPGAQTVFMAKSINGGGSFGAPVAIANVTSTAGNMNSGGVNIRTRGFPYIAIDHTPLGSATRGDIYVVFQAKPTSASRSEIYFTKSTDQGATWSAPRDISSGTAVTLNGDPTQNDNWQPSIAVSPVTGHIRVTFYSRRQDTANTDIRVFDAGSTDGGLTWFNQPRSSVAFKPSTGYDPLIVSSYMGDYIHVVASGGAFHAAWGDTRNICTPPGGGSPCSPAGRHDQDVFFSSEIDPPGPDLAITPWGYVTGNGPLWQTPDIYVVNGAGTVVNAQKLIVNRLRARVRNLGNAAANGATIRFKYAPIFVGLNWNQFEEIAAVSANFSALGGSTDLQEIPANWDLTNPAFNGSTGQWGANTIGMFDHFCVQVAVELSADVNQSNNWAQNNFVDVVDACCSPLRFLIGNPFDREIEARLVVAGLPKGYTATIRGTARGTEQPSVLRLKNKELQVATLELARPAQFDKEQRTQDVVAHVSMLVDNKPVGGLSIRLARANVRVRPAVEPASPGTRVAQGATPSPMPSPAAPPNPAVTLNVPALPVAAVRAIAAVLEQQRVPVSQADAERGLVSAGPVPLNGAQMREVIPPQFLQGIREATGRYYVTFKLDRFEQSTRVTVTTLIVVEKAELDSPIGGRILPSNGTLERRFAQAVTQAVQGPR